MVNKAGLQSTGVDVASYAVTFEQHDGWSRDLPAGDVIKPSGDSAMPRAYTCVMLPRMELIYSHLAGLRTITVWMLLKNTCWYFKQNIHAALFYSFSQGRR